MNDMKKTLIRFWHIELSRDFVLFMLAFGVLITILLYSPNELRNILKGMESLLERIETIAKQNGAIVKQTVTNTDKITDLAEQGVDNTDKIINDSAARFNVSCERTISILNQLSDFVNASETNRQALGEDFVNVFFSYLIDIRKDIDLILEKENVTKVEGSVSYNGTHLITKNGDSLQFPFKA